MLDISLSVKRKWNKGLSVLYWNILDDLIGVDPIAEIVNVGIHARIIGLGTAISPRGRPGENGHTADFGRCRSTRVTLTRVFSTTGDSSAEHAFCDGPIVAVANVACSTWDEVDADALKNAYKV